MNPIDIVFAQITEGLTSWIYPMLLTVVSSIISILMLICAGTLILGLIKGGDFFSMDVGVMVGKMKRNFESYGEDQEYQKILGEEKQRMRTSGLRARARKELEGRE